MYDIDSLAYRMYGINNETETAMTLLSQDHYDLIAMFDKLFKGRRLDKEDKGIWAKGRVYQDGNVNELFLAFRQGVAYGSAKAA